MATQTPLSPLLAMAGSWTGSNRLHDPFTRAPDDSPSLLVVVPMLQGRFVRLDYTWAYHGEPQEGSVLLGFEADAGTVTARWIDTWHVGDRDMTLTGPGGAAGLLDLRGSYAAPPGPDWGWRLQVLTTDDVICVIMHNVTPAGVEALAVEASYSREG